MTKELKDFTNEELFPKVRLQNLADVNMLDCSIDVEDKEMPIEIEELQTELSKFYHMDKHLIAIKLVHHFDECVGKDLITNSDGETLAADSEEVNKFKDSDLYKMVHKNEVLRLDFYSKLTSIESADGGWTKYYDEPTRRMFYKYTVG